MKKLYFLLAGLLIFTDFSVHAQTYQWAKRWGTAGNNNADGWDIQPDLFGGVYMVQRATNVQDLDYGAGTANSGTLSVQNTFIMRYSASGNFKWGFDLPGTTQFDLVIEPDAHGNFYVAGRYAGTTDFDPGPGTATLTAPVNTGFIAKYDSNMVFHWVKQFSVISPTVGSTYVAFNDFTMGNDDKLYYACYWAGTVDFNPGAASNLQTSTASGASDAVVVKLDSAGNYIWHSVAGANGVEEIQDLAVDNNNNKLLVTGYFNGNNNLFGTGCNSVGQRDVFFASLNTSNGTANFVKSFGGSGNDYGYAIEPTATGQIIVAGRYETTVDFDPGAGVVNKAVNSNWDPFIARYTANGNYVWVKPFTGFGFDAVVDMDVDNNNNTWLCIETDAYIDADPGTGVVSLGTAQGPGNALFVKLDSASNYMSSFAITGSVSAQSARPHSMNVSLLDNSVYVTGLLTGTMDFNPGAGVANLTCVSAGTGIYRDSYFAKYLGCGAAPAQPGTISGNTLVCQNSINTFTILPVANATSYTWTLPGGWSGSPAGTSITTTAGATSGNVTVTANNACGNSTIRTLSVTVNPVPTQPTSIAGLAGICPSSSGNYSIATIAGATSYSWTLPGGWTGSSSTNSIAITSGASGGTISVTASNACGASTAQTLNVTVNAPPTVTASAVSNTICNGSSTTLNAGGATNYTWQPGNIVGSTVAVSPSSNTIYTVSGSNGGCNNTAQVSVTVNSLPSVSISAGNGSVCIGSVTTLTASGATTYTWSTLATTSSISVAPVINTTYTVIGTSAAGCTNTSVKTITVNSLPSVSVTGAPTAICNNQTVTLTGSGALTYTWSTGSTNANISVSPSVTTNYTATGTDANGCVNSAIKVVTVNPSPTVTANTSSSIICSGTTTSLTASGATSYTWQPGNLVGTTVVVAPTNNTTYSVTGTNGCTNTANVSVSVNPLPVVSITANPVTICAGGSSTLTASTASPLSYTWSTNANTSNITTSISGIYSATITDVNGCNGSSSFTLGTSGSLSLTASSSLPSFCSGNTATLSVTGATSYTWSTNGTGNSIVVSPTTNTTYTVLGSSSPCTGTTAISVVVNTNPTVGVTTSSNIICTGQTASLTANGANTYTWNTGANGAQIAVTPTLTTTYTVTGTDNNGCINTSAITQSVSNCTAINAIISQNSEINIYPNPFDNKIIIKTNGDKQTIQIFSILGSIIYSSIIENQNTEIDLSNQSKGIYFIQIGSVTKKIIKE